MVGGGRLRSEVRPKKGHHAWDLISCLIISLRTPGTCPAALLTSRGTLPSGIADTLCDPKSAISRESVSGVAMPSDE